MCWMSLCAYIRQQYFWQDTLQAQTIYKADSNGFQNSVVAPFASVVASWNQVQVLHGATTTDYYTHAFFC